MVERVTGVDVYNQSLTGDVSKTLNSAATDSDHVPCVIIETNEEISGDVYCFEPGIAKREGEPSRFMRNMSGTLRAQMGDNKPAVCYAVENHPCDGIIKIDESGMVQTLRARMGTGGGNEPMTLIVLSSTNSNPTKNDVDVSPPIMARSGTGGGNTPIIAGKTEKKYILRRLTPTECGRLMGFPDWWVDGVEGSESAQYKMWGNGVGLNCVYWIMKRISKELKKGGS